MLGFKFLNASFCSTSLFLISMMSLAWFLFKTKSANVTFLGLPFLR
jgi:hypothetical protein